MTNLVSFDYFTILIYFLIMAGIGLFFKLYIKDVNAYLKGSGTIPWVIAGISNFMALFSTFVFVAYAGIAYEYGSVAIVVFYSTIPACLIGGLFFAKRWRRTEISSPIEYLETRFNLSVRQMVGWIGLIISVLDNMVRLYALGLFLVAVTPLNLPAALIISSIIIILFTLYGGVWAVTFMGTIQFVILVFISIILFLLSLDVIGGVSLFSQQLPLHFYPFNGPKGGFLWLSVYYIMIIIKYNSNWIFIQRFYIVKSERDAQKAVFLTAGLFLVFTVVFMFPSMVSAHLFPDLPDKEMAYVAIANRLLPPGLMGIMIASMFSATMSSLNSEYNVIAAVFSKDIYQRLINRDASDSHLLKVARLSTLFAGLIILAGGLFIQNFGGAFEANKLFTGIFAIPVGIPLVFGIVSRRTTSLGALLSIIFGSITGIVLNSFPDIFSWETATLIEIFVCVTIFFGSSFFVSKDLKNRERVALFFDKLNRKVRYYPTIDRRFKKSLSVLYLLSLLTAGLLFIIAGAFSYNNLSGVLSMASGLICLIVAIILKIFSK